MKKATLFQKLKSRKVKCLACSHYCIINPGKRGICGVRENRNGDLYLLVYGRAVALHIDPIEKKPLYRFIPKTQILSLGTVGCNFSCQFCQNADISQVSKPPTSKILGQKLLPKEIVAITKKEKISSIAYTYNEPAIFIEYAYDTARLAKKEGVKNVFVTNGYQSKESRKLITPYLDATNIDLKSFDEDFYNKFCQAKLKPVLETISDYYQNNIHIEITTLIIPTLNDSNKNLSAIAKFISKIDKNIPWHISRFFPCYKMANLPPTSIETLNRTLKIGREAGLKYIYIGNG